MMAVSDEFHRHVDALQETDGVDAAQNETALIQGFRALGAGADADRWEGMSDAGEERALLGQGTTVTHHGESVHLQAVVVVEAEGFMLDDTRVELEATGLETLATARMTAI